MTQTVDYTVNTRYTSDTTGLDRGSAAQRELTASGREAAISKELLERSARETGRAYDQLNRKGKRVARELERVEGQLDDTSRSTHQYRRQVRALDAAYKQGFVSQARHAELLKLAERRYRSSTSWLGRMTTSFRGWIGAAAAAAALTVGGGIVSAGDTQEQLLNQLEISLQSRRAAEQEYAQLKEFAASTPARIEGLTDAFSKLAIRGLKPTIEELRIFGDIAGGSRKSLDQFVEAVLDASVGEGERLKEFGIKMRTVGEQVTLTFGDMALTVPKDATAIKDALLEIGRAQFAGGMAKQAETLTGKWSTLQDAGSQLAAKLYEAGVGDILKTWADAAIYLATHLGPVIDLAKQAAEFSPFGLINTGISQVGDGLADDIAEITAQGAELRDVIHGTQAALDSLSASRMQEQLAKLGQDSIKAEAQLDALGAGIDRAFRARDSEVVEAQRRAFQEQADLVDLYRVKIAALETQLASLGPEQRRQTQLTDEQTAALDGLKQQLTDELAILRQLRRAANDGERDLAGLRQTLEALQRQKIQIDGGEARRELEALRWEVAQLSRDIEQIEKIRLFETDATAEAELLRRLIAAAEVPGTTLKGLDRLETELRTLQDLGLPLDADGRGAAKVRELTELVDALRDRLASLRGDLEAVQSLQAVDVAPAPGTTPGFTDRDETAEAYRRSPRLDDPVAEQIARAQSELDAMSAAVAESLRNGLVDALRDAAEEGRLAFEDVFRALQGQLGNLFERAALSSVQLTGDQTADAAATEQALGQAAAAASAVSSVLSVYYAVYTIVDSWVEERRWERAHTGAVRLEQLLSGEVAGDLQRSGSAVVTLMQQAGEAAADTIEGLLYAYRGTLDRLSGIVELRVNEGTYEVAVGSFARSFGQSAQAAFDYFIVQALRHAEISGASDEVLQTLQHSRAESVAGLEQELAVAQQIHQLPWDQVQRAIHSAEQSMRELFRFAEEKLLSIQSFENIGASSAADVLTLYQSITGQSLSAGERFDADAASFNRLLAEVVARTQTEIAGLTERIASLLAAGLGAGAGASFTGPLGGGGVLSQSQEPGGRLTFGQGYGRVQHNQGDLLSTLQGRLAGLEAFLAALPPTIAASFRPAGDGSGRQRRETREDFGRDLRRLRSLADGAAEVGLALEEEAHRWQEQAETFRRAGVPQDLIDEWLHLQEVIEDRRFVEAIRERGRALGETDFLTSLRQLREAQAAEIEEAHLREVGIVNLTDIERVHRGEVEALIATRERELRQYTDLLDGITPWQRTLLDLDDAFDAYRREQVALAEAQHGLASSAGTLTEALARLDDAQQATAEGLYTDLLQRLQSAGVVIPGFGRTLLDLEFAMLRADLAAAVAREGFTDWLDGQGIVLADLFAGIDQAYQTAVANLDAPPTGPSFEPPGLGDVGGIGDNQATVRALEAVTAALEQLRGDDPRKTEPERLADLQLRYRQALDAALAGDNEAAEDAARLALELREALALSGTATGQYLALFTQLDGDLSGLQTVLEDQLSDREVQLHQLTVLEQIRDNTAATTTGGYTPPASPPPTATGDGDSLQGPASTLPRLGGKAFVPDTLVRPPVPTPSRTPADRSATLHDLLARAVVLLGEGNRQRVDAGQRGERQARELRRQLEQAASRGPLRDAAVEHGGRGRGDRRGAER